MVRSGGQIKKKPRTPVGAMARNSTLVGYDQGTASSWTAVAAQI